VRPPTPTKEELESVLTRLGGSVRATAKYFGRDRRQIYRWLEAYNLGHLRQKNEAP
jgi:transposase